MDVTRKSARKWIDSLSTRVQQVLFAAATYLILLAICMLAISPEQYDLSAGDVAPKTITAPRPSASATFCRALPRRAWATSRPRRSRPARISSMN